MAQPLAGNTDEKSVEGVVDLLVADGPRDVGPQHVAKLRRADQPRFQHHKRTLLDIFAEKFLRALHAQAFESIHTALALDVEHHSAEVEKKISYHNGYKITKIAKKSTINDE